MQMWVLAGVIVYWLVDDWLVSIWGSVVSLSVRLVNLWLHVGWLISWLVVSRVVGC